MNLAPLFSRGLERVLPQSGREANPLPPDKGPLLPAETGPSRHVDRVVGAADTDQLLLHRLRTELSDPQLLLPEIHRSLLSESGAEMERLAAENDNPDLAPILAQAAQMLRDEWTLHELLDHNRAALHQA